MSEDKSQRRALGHQGGKRRSSGDPEIVEVLDLAFQRAATEDPDIDTHGLHPWPARLHRSIADELLRLAPIGARVLDPFCGSGTVLIEARAQGFQAAGVDLNPLALRVAEVKCRTPSQKTAERFRATLDAVVEANKERVRNKAQAHAPLPKNEIAYYQGHVLRELGGLFEEIDAVTNEEDRHALKVLLSAIVVKFSRQRADTSDQQVEKRIGRFIPTEFFQKRGHELLERWASLARRTPPGAPAPRLFEADARQLGEILDPVDLVITSPPYGGTYDYVGHHARRYPWLGIDARRFERDEMGARRRLSRGRDAARDWDSELLAFLHSLRDVLTPRARAVLLQGDAEVGGQRVPADEQVAGLAAKAGLEVEAVCSEERPDFRGGESREEHLIVLVTR